MRSLYIVLLLFSCNYIGAQISSVKYQIDYDYDEFHYDMNLIIDEGMVNVAADLYQTDIAITIVGGPFSDLEILEMYLPIEPSGSMPSLWDIVWSEAGIDEENIYFHTRLLQPLLAEYQDVAIGDTLTLFSFSIGSDCEGVRLWDTAIDPFTTTFASGYNFSQRFILETSNSNIYTGNIDADNPLPSAPGVHITGDDQLCVGETEELSPSSGGTWVSTNPAVATVTSTGIVTGQSPGFVNFMYVQDGTGCEPQPYLAMTVGDEPDIAVGDTELCIGEVAQAQPSSGGVWTSSDPSVLVVSNSGLITAVSPGTTTVQYTDFSSGCTSQPSELITVTAASPTEFIGPTEICVGQVTQIISNGQGVWSSADDAIATITNNGLITGVAPGVTTFTFTDILTGCNSEPSEPLTVGASTNEVSQSIACFMDGATYLQSTNTNGTWTYVSGPVGAIAIIGDANASSTLVSGFEAPGVYTFSYAGGSFCEQFFTVSVGTDCDCAFINNLIVPPAESSLCYPDSFILRNLAWISPDTSLIWEVDVNGPDMTNPDVFASQVSEVNFNPTDYLNQYAGGTVWVRSISETGPCRDTSNVVQLEISPNVEQEIYAPDFICAGEPLQLIVEILPQGCSVVWQGPNGFTATGQFLTIEDPSLLSAGTYKATITCGDCVTEVSTEEIQFFETDDALVLADPSICVGQNTTATLTSGLAVPIVSNNPSVATVDQNTGVITGVANGSVTFTAFLPNSECAITSHALIVGEVPVTINGSDVICAFGFTQLSPSTGGTWSSSNPSIATVTNTGVVTAIQPGCASFTFTSSADGCTGTTGLICVEDCFDPCDPNDNTETNIFGGTAYIDANQNGMYDATEQPLTNVLVSIPGTPISVLTDGSGQYSLTVPVGTYSIKATANQGNWEQTELTLNNVSSSTPCLDGLDFGFILAPAPPAINLTLVSQNTRCEEEVWFYVHYQNAGSEPFTGHICVTFDPVTEYTGFLNSNGTLNENTVCWYVEDVPPLQSNTYQFQLTMPEVQMPILVMEFVAQAIDEEGEVLKTDEYIAELRCSFDPNDKAVKPWRSGNSFKTLIDEEEMEYHIRFQNNGNDTAYIVTIEDELDENLDPRSVRVVGASHYMVTTIAGRMLTFTFPDIYLVDSMTNYPESQGYVTFRAKTLPGLEHNTSVDNDAAIIFDSNPPIVTNEVSNLMVKDLCLDPKVSSETRTICAGDSYLGYTMAGTYTIEHTTMYDCDSTHMLQLEVQQPTTSTAPVADICSGGTVVINGITYNAAGTYMDTSYTAEGCIDLINTQEIVLQPGLQTEEFVTICEGDSYLGYDASGTYEEQGTSAAGCDSVHIIELLVETSSLVEVSSDLCPGSIVSVNGQQYMEAGQYSDTTYTATGCVDRIFDIMITGLQPIEISIDTTICDGESYMDLTIAGTYIIEVPGESGCDSILSIGLTVLPADDPACITAADDIDKAVITISPNPALSYFQVAADDVIDNITLISVTAGNATVHSSIYMDGVATVKTDDIPAGVYIVSMQIRGVTHYRKVVVL